MRYDLHVAGPPAAVATLIAADATRFGDVAVVGVIGDNQSKLNATLPPNLDPTGVCDRLADLLISAHAAGVHVRLLREQLES
jgi:hypothetical protein